MQIDDASADDVMAQLLCLESMDPDRDISIYINSPGGSYTAMTAIYDTMQFVKPQIQTVCLGQAASAAAVLLAAGAPGKRFALPHARVLIHQPYTEGGGQGTDIEIQASEMLRMREEMEGILAQHTGRDAATRSTWTSSATRSSPRPTRSSTASSTGSSPRARAPAPEAALRAATPAGSAAGPGAGVALSAKRGSAGVSGCPTGRYGVPSRDRARPRRCWRRHRAW